MSLAAPDRDIVEEELGRAPTREEAALFENLWSEHCAYRSSRPLLGAFESEGEHVVVGPGDDAAVVSLPGAEDVYITLGIESHNHPSYVDPYDGAATGVGGIVRDTLSMGAYPVALADSLYFGPFDREHSRYLLEGVVEGIADYGNAIGVPTVAGSVDFHPDYEGNPLVNVACVGLTSPDRLVTAEAREPGNRLVLVGNATGRDGLGGASFASEDLSEDAETEDRPAVQVGDPYAEKLLIECNGALLDEDLVVSARDLGAAGLGGATSELVAKGGLGADIDLGAVHQREPGMNALELLLAESQERMCYEVRPGDLERVRELADRFDLGCSVVGRVTEGNYVCRFEGEVVVDVPAGFLADGAPTNDLPAETPAEPERSLPEADLRESFEAVLASPNTASKRWVYRQYDHEVGVRTARRPGDDAAVLAVREAADADVTDAEAADAEAADAEAADGDGDDATDVADADAVDADPTGGPGVGLALSAGANPLWTSVAPRDGARAVALENATNLAAKGATPLAAVDCLNGGNPEKPEVYGGFAGVVDGLAAMCGALEVPVVGGNVSLYNDSAAGPIPPTPTVAMVGTRAGYDAPPMAVAGEGELFVVGTAGGRLGGSAYLARAGGSDRFPSLPADPAGVVDALATVADEDSTLAVHDVSHGGLAVTLAEMVAEGAGVDASVGDRVALFDETPGRAVVETTDPEGLRGAFDGVADVERLGTATASGELDLAVGGETLRYDAGELAALRDVLAAELD